MEKPREENIILKQLIDLEKAMVEEFGFPESAIEISIAPNAAKDYREQQQKGPYDYAFTAL